MSRTFSLVALLSLAACSADPVLLPDAGPCGGACGPGTVCVGSACVSADGGTPDAPVDAGSAIDAAVDVVDAFVGTDPVPTDVQALDAPPGDLGVDDDRPDVASAPDMPAVDLGPTDVGTPDAGFVDAGTDSGIDPRCDGGLPDFCANGRATATTFRANFCTFLGTDNVNCGACGGDVCNTAARHCELGVCRLNCPSGASDCNASAVDACETNTNTSNTHCGRCGNACAAGTRCVGGGCLP